MCISLIGPCKICRKGQLDLECKCVTKIDPASGWFEIHQYDNKKSITVASIVEQECLSRYPWPTQVTYDRGREFIGKDFQKMLVNDYEIKKKPITVRNPQATGWPSTCPVFRVKKKLHKTCHVLGFSFFVESRKR